MQDGHLRRIESPDLAGAANVGNPPLMSIDTNGPNLTFASWTSAAVQRHQTGHSSILQHFRRVKVGSADVPALIPAEGCS